MITAFVLINTEGESEEIVLDRIRSIPGVKEVSAVYGTYDIICKVEEHSLSLLKNTIFEQIRKIEMVRSTITLVVM